VRWRVGGHRAGGGSARDGCRWFGDTARSPNKLIVKRWPFFAHKQPREWRQTLKLIDQALTGTRGAAGAIVELCSAKGHVPVNTHWSKPLNKSNVFSSFTAISSDTCSRPSEPYTCILPGEPISQIDASAPSVLTLFGRGGFLRSRPSVVSCNAAESLRLRPQSVPRLSAIR
jgi:hypothetical protein